MGLNISPADTMDIMGGGMDMNSMAAMGIDMNAMDAELIKVLNVNWFKVLACFMIYFVGGYLVYASLFAMFGSAANDSQEASQFMMPVMVIMMLAFYVGFAASRNPEGSLAFWGSIIPFTSPIVMMVRVPLEVPIWEIALSIALLFITAILCIMLSGKIYRVGILMTGKKVTFKEIFKWLKYK